MTNEQIQIMLYGTVVVKDQEQKALEHVEADKSILGKKAQDCIIKDSKGRYWLPIPGLDEDGLFIPDADMEEVTDDQKFINWHLERGLVIER